MVDAEDAVMRRQTGWDTSREAKETGRSEAALKHLEPSSTGEYVAKLTKKIETSKKTQRDFSKVLLGRGLLRRMQYSLVWRADNGKELEWLSSAKSNSQAIASQTLIVAAKIINLFEIGR